VILVVMTTVDARLEPLLVAIVRAYRTDVGGSRQPLMHCPSFANGDTLEHEAWPAHGPAIDAERLDELEQLGLVRIEDLGAARSVRAHARGDRRRCSVPART
jgi:hypothetical protein